MKNVFIAKCFGIACLFSVISFDGFAKNYKAALVADMNSGKILYQENAKDLNYPASLTKIMTLYLTFDALNHGRLNLDDYLIVSQSAANASPVKLGLKAGSKIKVEDAISALAVYSANDVARVLAENLKGGREGSFASLMTDTAADIGLSQTNFENSSGLPNDDQQSSARDIALLSIAVYKHFPEYWKYFGMKSWSYNGKTYYNGNRLLGTYPGCDGMKTGYTNKSKYSLVSTANRDGKHLISVVLGADNKDVRASVSVDMLNKGFEMMGVEKSEMTISKPTPLIEKKVTTTTVVKKSSTGNSGVQFGAFSSMNAAKTQQLLVENRLGVATDIETTASGLYRVRANGMSRNDAVNVKDRATNAGINSFVF